MPFLGSKLDENPGFWNFRSELVVSPKSWGDKCLVTRGIKKKYIYTYTNVGICMNLYAYRYVHTMKSEQIVKTSITKQRGSPRKPTEADGS